MSILFYIRAVDAAGYDNMRERCNIGEMDPDRLSPNEINELRREIKALKATQVASGPRHKGGVGSDRSFGSRGMRGGLEDAFLDAASFRSDSREELPPL